MKSYFNWSTGKDSALALFHMQQQHYDVQLLLTSVNSQYDRVSMHGVRRSLLKRQVQALGLPNITVELPEKPSMDEYEDRMRHHVEQLAREGYQYAGFGDIFLNELRKNREDKLRPYHIECVFPLWKRDTHDLMREFLHRGFQTIVVSTQASVLDDSFVGRVIDETFLNDLPENVDPCGENGEFHTFCFDGPCFREPVPFTVGEKVYREYQHEGQSYGYWFCDLIPQGEECDACPAMP